MEENNEYGIAGWFIQGPYIGQIFFGGHFEKGYEDCSVDEFLPNAIDGVLIDNFGSSSIEGEMHEDFFYFIKKYSRYEDTPIKYRYKKENGVWVDGTS